MVVNKLRKSVNICQSYHKNKRVSFFMGHSVVTYRLRIWFVAEKSYISLVNNNNIIINTEDNV